MLCECNLYVTYRLSSQTATNAENYSISKRHLEAALAYSITPTVNESNGEHYICIMALTS